MPIKRFELAKRRLAPVLDDDQRARLAEWLAGRAAAAAAPHPLFVVCDDSGVARWAERVGASVLWTPGLGLNGAVDAARSTIAGKGFDHFVIAHSDLILATDLAAAATTGTITLTPDRYGDGTNVMALPADAPIAATYGGGSFAAHLAQALRSGRPVEVRRDPRLAIDIDRPADLFHPAVVKELPSWLQTILANRC